MEQPGEHTTRYDLIVKGGRVIDPAQGIDGPMDVAIGGGKVAAVAPSIPASQTKQVVDAAGKIVTPGWIDLHVHCFWGVSTFGIDPDLHFLNRGVTTVVDMGSAGAQTWPAFRRFIIEQAKTRIIAFLHISTGGLISRTVLESNNIRMLMPDQAVEVASANRDIILGIKVRLTKNIVGSNGLKPLYLARQAADALGSQLAVHPNNPDGTLEEILSQLKPGDVLTHCFHGTPNGILDGNGRVKAAVWGAVQRGVYLDVGHGFGSFAFPVVESALEQGLKPHSISTDLHAYSLYTTAFDQATTLSKFLYLGLPFPEIIRMTTANPARIIGREGTLGTLAPGAEADVTICEVQDTRCTFVDCRGNTREACQRIVPLGVVRAGQYYRCGEVPPLV